MYVVLPQLTIKNKLHVHAEWMWHDPPRVCYCTWCWCPTSYKGGEVQIAAVLRIVPIAGKADVITSITLASIFDGHSDGRCIGLVVL